MTDYLIDTHVFVWWQWRSTRLGERARDAIEDPSHRIFVSAASVWEIAFMAQRGKLRFSHPPSEAIAANAFHERPIFAQDAEFAARLEWTNKDAFDRILIAQAIRGSLVLISADAEILRFPGVARLSAM